jgi:hypothetical protein
MRLNPPKKVTFWASIAIAVLSIVVYILHIIFLSFPFLGAFGYLIMIAAFVLLVLGLVIKGL